MVGRTVTVGRDPGPGGLRVTDPQRGVSRQHLLLTRTEHGTVVLRDISRNGSLVNGRRTTPNADVSIQPCTRIRLPGGGGMLTLQVDFSLALGPAPTPVRIAPSLRAAHKTLVGGRDYITSKDGWWRQAKAGPARGTPWKLHIFADSAEDWLSVARVVLPYLKRRPLSHKTVARLEKLDTLNETDQAGKAFTVYFSTVAAMARAARELHGLIHHHGLARQGPGIYGDCQLGSTGRLFYRYDEDGRGHYRPNDGRCVPALITRDPFEALSRSLA